MKFKNYINRFNRSNRIFSDEDLLKMTLEKILDEEDSIMSQNSDIGIPTYSELESSPNTEWVKPAEDNQRGYWQSIIQQPETQMKTGLLSENPIESFAPINGNNPVLSTNSTDNILSNNTNETVPLLEGGVQKNDLRYLNKIKSGYKDGTISGAASNISDKFDNVKETSSTGKLNYLQGMFNDYKSLEDPGNTALYVIGEFLNNYNNMRDADTHGADKYFHAKANYEAAQQGIVGSTVAKIISDIRELTDAYRNINQKGYTKEESIKDSDEDQIANEEGRRLGRMYPTKPAYEILKHLMPKGFPERYRRRW